jgi:TonB-linked SusC/RagA family outer membrane protein
MFKSLLLKGRTLCLLLCCMVSSLVVTAQTKHTGKVIGSDDGLPVVGASVRIKGTNTGAVTDVNGDFNLSLSAGNVLVVSYIGYQTLEVTVNGTQFVTVSLHPSNNSLNEVVVTGYTTQRKKDISGSVATVNISDATKVPSSSSEQLLQGQASGVTVMNNGAPGAASTVFIRGIANFGNTTPLYVIDGVQTNSMSNVNPSDIESISVLKDAGAAAIYGVSGGNGVIVITTKKGKSGKSTISYDGYYSVNQPIGGNVWNLMNPVMQSKLAYLANDPSASTVYAGPGVLYTYGYHGANAPAGAGAAFGTAGVTNDASIVNYYHFDAGTPANDFLVEKFNQSGTDWFHTIFKAAPEQNHNITASGGSDKNTYLFSVNYLNDEGTLIDDYAKRYSARINTNFNISDHIRIGETGYVYYLEQRGGGGSNQQEGGPVSYTYREMPIIPVYDVGGNYGGNYEVPGSEPFGNGSNPAFQQNNTINNFYRNWNIQGSMFAEADISKHFTIRTVFGGNVDNYYANAIGATEYEAYESHTNPNTASEEANYTFNYNWTNSVQYHQTIGKHNIQVFAGFETKEQGGRDVQDASSTYFSLDPQYLVVQDGTTTPTLGNYLDQPTNTESVFGRLDYTYNDRYILGATIRRDGYSDFFPGRQWGTFPSVSLAWRVSQEDFLKGVSWINDLKIRGSYGEAGNNGNITGSNAYTTYDSGNGASNYGISGANSLTQGFYAKTYGNENTTWETDKIFNVGFDASLFNNHFDLTAEYYKKQSDGLLFALQLPATVGGANPPSTNIGAVQNSGVDISATYHGRISQDFTFNINGTLTTYKSLITSLPGGPFEVASSARDNNIVKEIVGQPIGEFYGYQITGIYQNTAAAAQKPTYPGAEAGSFIYKDNDGDGAITPTDRAAIGNPNPDFTYGLNLNANYKRWDFTMVLYGSYGNKDFNWTKFYTDFYNPFPGGKSIPLYENSAIVTNGVVTGTEAHPGDPAAATLPVASINQALGSSTVSSYYVESGSFLKCRVLQVGYTFDPTILKRIGFDKLHIYAQATNLFTITKYDGLDPELAPPQGNNGISNGNASAAFGIDYGAYPTNQRQYILGVNLTF